MAYGRRYRAKRKYSRVLRGGLRRMPRRTVRYRPAPFRKRSMSRTRTRIGRRRM